MDALDILVCAFSFRDGLFVLVSNIVVALSLLFDVCNVSSSCMSWYFRNLVVEYVVRRAELIIQALPTHTLLDAIDVAHVENGEAASAVDVVSNDVDGNVSAIFAIVENELFAAILNPETDDTIWLELLDDDEAIYGNVANAIIDKGGSIRGWCQYGSSL